MTPSSSLRIANLYREQITAGLDAARKAGLSARMLLSDLSEDSGGVLPIDLPDVRRPSPTTCDEAAA
jgi:hypothetical protein